MPPKKMRNNHTLVRWLEELRDDQEHGSNKYNIYDRAAQSMANSPIAFDLRDLAGVAQLKYIGPNIRAQLEKRASAELKKATSAASSKSDACSTRLG